MEAVTIIWIASEFSDEHRATLDWLNEHTAQGINFFGIVIEVKTGNGHNSPMLLANQIIGQKVLIQMVIKLMEN